jgi:hypothetical protein
MHINKGLNILIRSFIIFIISIFLGVAFFSSGSDDIAKAETDETINTTDSGNLDIIIINNEDYEKDRKGPVKFEHKAHANEYEITCWECHHEYEDGENIWAPWETTLACIDCHDPSMAMDEIIKLQTAYHNNCKNCHKDQAIYGDDAQAYRKCNTCHLKEE